jgi:multiple sugar transport system ATP-binding protein
MTLADRIVVLKDGLVMQIGTPVELYERPDNLFVAEFIGSPKMNILPCSAKPDHLVIEGHNGVSVTVGPGSVNVGIRPEHISPCAIEDSHVSGIVEFAEYLGSDTFLYVNCGSQGTLTVRTTGAAADFRGQLIGLRFDETSMHLFDAEGLAI